MDFNPNVPIYIQIMDEFKKNIVSGNYELGSRVKSVRDLAVEYGVNPNTVQRALSELEREGLLKSERTAGRFISEDQDLISKLEQEQATSMVRLFIGDMHDIGYDDAQILNAVKNELAKKDD
ncbi:GntR family transcriptional regulator [Erysipelotrichaceae bacterium MTC7]|nr:GntR family transcriptional regulator [Erysipelotrichaceae bacterium MTC7]